uniref:Uncharacterized protein n=1 Tax=Parascaris equorum TaxID=6256 RepID=A0A914RTU7_PAREQ
MRVFSGTGTTKQWAASFTCLVTRAPDRMRATLHSTEETSMRNNLRKRHQHDTHGRNLSVQHRLLSGGELRTVAAQVESVLSEKPIIYSLRPRANLLVNVERTNEDLEFNSQSLNTQNCISSSGVMLRNT